MAGPLIEGQTREQRQTSSPSAPTSSRVSSGTRAAAGAFTSGYINSAVNSARGDYGGYGALPGSDDEKSAKPTLFDPPSPDAWADYINDVLLDDMKSAAGLLGVDPALMFGWYDKYSAPMFQYLRDEVLPSFQTNVGGTWPDTPAAFDTLYKFARNWLGQQDPYVGKALRGHAPNLPKPKGPGGSGRRGSAGPSAADIRAQFDLDELSGRIDSMWKGYLLETPTNARAIASAYVDQIVKNPNQRLDFDTYVLNRIKGTARYKSIYRNMPESEDPLEYIGRYQRSALTMLRPDNAARVAIGGAQFGADPAAFAARVQREDEVTGSAPFISGLERRLESVGGVLKG